MLRLPIVEFGRQLALRFALGRLAPAGPARYQGVEPESEPFYIAGRSSRLPTVTAKADFSVLESL